MLQMLLLAAASATAAEQVDRNSVILKEVRVLKNARGTPVAKELVYAGGIGGNLASSPNARPLSALREIQPLTGKFTLTEDGLVIVVRKIPIVVESIGDRVSEPAAGRWEFSIGDARSYADAVHVSTGGDLDIIYQSTGMRQGDQDSVLHYGLGGNPHAVSLSRQRLEQAFASRTASRPKPTLDYEPADDVILVQIQLTPEGLLFQPIFDYEVVK